MKTLIWKLRFTIAARRLLRVSWAICWDIAGANLESLRGDTTECPLSMAQEEHYAWAHECLGEYSDT